MPNNKCVAILIRKPVSVFSTWQVFHGLVYSVPYLQVRMKFVTHDGSYESIRSTEVWLLSQPLPYPRFNPFIISESLPPRWQFLDPVVNPFKRQTLPAVNRKYFFMNILYIESSCPGKTHNRTLLSGSTFLKQGRLLYYWNQLLNMRMRVCYLDCHEPGLCCYLMIRIEKLLHQLQLFYFHLWPIYWISLIRKWPGIDKRWLSSLVRQKFYSPDISVPKKNRAYPRLRIYFVSVYLPSVTIQDIESTVPSIMNP
jgi:hypothetical protein